jgi:hypothetical protein
MRRYFWQPQPSANQPVKKKPRAQRDRQGPAVTYGMGIEPARSERQSEAAVPSLWIFVPASTA